MHRLHTPELMDEPDASPEELGRALGFIRAVNRRMGGETAILTPLQRWSVRWPTDEPVTVLDVATGSADLPLAVAKWSETTPFDVRITGVDNHPTTLDHARAHTDGHSKIKLMEADAFDLIGRFGEQSFDYVHAGMFLHHMPDDAAIVHVLGDMLKLARRGVIWNDLVRSRVGLTFITLLTLGKPDMIRHDARASVRAGFKKNESMELAHKAGWSFAGYDWNLFTHRFVVSGERTNAW